MRADGPRLVFRSLRSHDQARLCPHYARCTLCSPRYGNSSNEHWNPAQEIGASRCAGARTIMGTLLQTRTRVAPHSVVLGVRPNKETRPLTPANYRTIVQSFINACSAKRKDIFPILAAQPCTRVLRNAAVLRRAPPKRVPSPEFRPLRASCPSKGDYIASTKAAPVSYITDARATISLLPVLILVVPSRAGLSTNPKGVAGSRTSHKQCKPARRPTISEENVFPLAGSGARTASA
jgi:hypothetical protein